MLMSLLLLGVSVHGNGSILGHCAERFAALVRCDTLWHAATFPDCSDCSPLRTPQEGERPSVAWQVRNYGRRESDAAMHEPVIIARRYEHVHTRTVGHCGARSLALNPAKPAGCQLHAFRAPGSSRIRAT